jgi:hypothetical protein
MLPVFNSREEVMAYLVQHTQAAKAEADARMEEAQSRMEGLVQHAYVRMRERQEGKAHLEGQNAALAERNRVLEVQHQADAMSMSALRQALPMGGETGRPRLPSSLKVPQVESYGGDRKDDVDAWLFKLEETFHLAGVADDETRIMYAGQLLKGNAGTWFYSVRRDEAVDRVTSWDEFHYRLKAHFVPTDQVKAARDEIYRMQQTGNVRDYTARFRHLASVIRVLPDAELKHLYQMGLKGRTKQELSMRDPKTFRDAIEMAEKFEAVVYTTSSSYSSGWQDRAGDRTVTQPPPADGATPMELNAMEYGMMNGPPRQYTEAETAERERRRRDRLCFECGSPDHTRNDCPDRAKKAGNRYSGKGQQQTAQSGK